MIDLTGYKLTFDDEFNQRSISNGGNGTVWSDVRSEWRFDANSDIGFGNSSFVDPASGYDPFKVADGALSITAAPDHTSYGYPGSWESGLITTQGHFSQTYGYFEMRADLSDVPGSWDAFWMMPDHQVNATSTAWQELDVVEHYGTDPGSTYRWIHTTDPSSNVNQERQVTTKNPEQTSGYHTYGMDWGPDQIKFYFDGEYMGSKQTPSDMHGPMYLMADLATLNADPNGAPLTMKIDYVRAYSADPNSTAVALDTSSAPDGSDPGLHGAVAANDPTHTSVLENAGAIPSPVTHDASTPTGPAGSQPATISDALGDNAPATLPNSSPAPLEPAHENVAPALPTPDGTTTVSAEAPSPLTIASTQGAAGSQGSQLPSTPTLPTTISNPGSLQPHAHAGSQEAAPHGAPSHGNHGNAGCVHDEQVSSHGHDDVALHAIHHHWMNG